MTPDDVARFGAVTLVATVAITFSLRVFAERCGTVAFVMVTIGATLMLVTGLIALSAGMADGGVPW